MKMFIFLTVNKRELQQWYKDFMKDCPNGILRKEVSFSYSYNLNDVRTNIKLLFLDQYFEIVNLMHITCIDSSIVSFLIWARRPEGILIFSACLSVHPSVAFFVHFIGNTLIHHVCSPK